MLFPVVRCQRCAMRNKVGKHIKPTKLVHVGSTMFFGFSFSSPLSSWHVLTSPVLHPTRLCSTRVLSYCEWATLRPWPCRTRRAWSSRNSCRIELRFGDFGDFWGPWGPWGLSRGVAFLRLLKMSAYLDARNIKLIDFPRQTQRSSKWIAWTNILEDKSIVWFMPSNRMANQWILSPVLGSSEWSDPIDANLRDHPEMSWDHHIFR